MGSDYSDPVIPLIQIPTWYSNPYLLFHEPLYHYIWECFYSYTLTIINSYCFASIVAKLSIGSYLDCIFSIPEPRGIGPSSYQESSFDQIDLKI